MQGIMNKENSYSEEMENEVREKMKHYWQLYKPSIESMMLSHDAKYLTENEQNELLSYLPHYKGKKVLELGAGIGRFTSRFAVVADHVTAIDFMEAYIKKNEESNGHFENITFQCADVTKLDLPENSFDLVFSNWLLMYLSDSEVEKLMKGVLKWLKPDGSFFFRESCYHQSGNVARAENPTKYRTPLDYIMMLNKASTNKNQFNVKSAKNVLTYIYYHGNPNQLCLLAQKKEKKNLEIININTPLEKINQNGTSHNYSNTDDYTNLRHYSFIDSSSGEFLIKDTGIKLGLRSGHRVLNICCEEGEVPMFLVKQFDVFVHGVDVSPVKIHYAIEKQGKLELSLRKKIQYEATEWTEADLPTESYEAVLSYDFLLTKQLFMKLMVNSQKWLKNNGKFVCCVLVSIEDQEFGNETAKELLTENQLRNHLKSLSFTLQEAKLESSVALKYLKSLESNLTKALKNKLARGQTFDMLQDINRKINQLEKKEIKLLKIIANKY